MHYEIKIFIDPNSCAYFKIDPEKYKERMNFAVHDLGKNIEIIINYSHSISDGVFPLAISMLTESSGNQQSTVLNRVQLIASAVFQELATNV